MVRPSISPRNGTGANGRYERRTPVAETLKRNDGSTPDIVFQDIKEADEKFVKVSASIAALTSFFRLR